MVKTVKLAQTLFEHPHSHISQTLNSWLSSVDQLRGTWNETLDALAVDMVLKIFSSTSLILGKEKVFQKRRKLAKWKLVSVHGCCSINKFEIWRMRRVSAFRISRFRTLNQVSASGLHSPLHHWYILLNKVALQNAFFEEVRNRQDAKQPVGLQSAFLLTKHTRRPYFRNYVQQSKRKKRANYQLSQRCSQGGCWRGSSTPLSDQNIDGYFLVFHQHCTEVEIRCIAKCSLAVPQA